MNQMSWFHEILFGINKMGRTCGENLQIEISPESINCEYIAWSRQNRDTKLCESVIKSSWELNLESNGESLAHKVDNESASRNWEKEWHLSTVEHSNESDIKDLWILNLNFVICSTVECLVSGHGSLFGNVHIHCSLSI